MKVSNLFENIVQKAGIIPYIYDGDSIRMLFMIPSDPNYGGTKPNIAKGGVDEGETRKEAALREGNEELGLLARNIKKSSLKLAWHGNAESKTDSSIMTVFTCEVKSASDFDKPHFETKNTVWLTPDEFESQGRVEHKTIVSSVVKVIKNETR